MATAQKETFRIIRSYITPTPDQTIRTGLTEREADRHLRREDAKRRTFWFDRKEREEVAR